MNVLMNVLRFWRLKNKRLPSLNNKEEVAEAISNSYIIYLSSNDDSDKMKSALE
jgi:hypothetical protein